MLWGCEHLGKHEYKESIEEMERADKLVKRVLFLDGLLIGEKVPEILEKDLKIERAGRE